MRKKELVQKNNRYVRLTITPDRITLKTRNKEEENDISRYIDMIEKKFDSIDGLDRTKTFRGRLFGKHEKSFHFMNESKTQELRIII